MKIQKYILIRLSKCGGKLSSREIAMRFRRCHIVAPSHRVESTGSLGGIRHQQQPQQQRKIHNVQQAYLNGIRYIHIYSVMCRLHYNGNFNAIVLK